MTFPLKQLLIIHYLPLMVLDMTCAMIDHTNRYNY